MDKYAAVGLLCDDSILLSIYILPRFSKEAEKRRNTPRGAAIRTCPQQMPVEEFARDGVVIDVLRTDPCPTRWIVHIRGTRLDCDFCFTATRCRISSRPFM